MFILGQGKSTGEIKGSFDCGGVTITSAEYTVEECDVGMHYHENPHISFLYQGADVERRSTGSYERTTGNIYFYYAGEEHSSVFRTMLSKNINIDFGRTFLSKYCFAETYIDRAVTRNLDAKFLILKMRQEMLRSDNSNLAIETLLLELIGGAGASSNRATPTWALRLADLLNDRWNEQLSLDELSLAVGAHPVTISKHFRKYFSCTLGEYLRKLKVDRSLSLIKNSAMSLTEIAFHCGFADQSHFTRTFQRVTGFLPKEFRNL